MSIDKDSACGTVDGNDYGSDQKQRHEEQQAPDDRKDPEDNFREDGSLVVHTSTPELRPALVMGRANTGLKGNGALSGGCALNL
jgi:hypothetical protein